MSISLLSNNYFKILPKEVLSYFYTFLDPHSARYLSQTDSLLKNFFSSVEMQKMLIPIHFGPLPSPSIFPPVHYHRLLCARSKNAEITLQKTTFWQQPVIWSNIINGEEFILAVPLIHDSSNEVRFVNLKRNECTKINIEASKEICCAYRKDEDNLIIGFYQESKLEFWDLNTKECTGSLDAKNEKTAFWCWQISSDGKTAISVHSNELFSNLITHGVMLKLWDLTSKQCLHTLENLSICIDHLKMIPNSTKFLTSMQCYDTDEGEVYSPIVWDFSTNKSMKILLNLDSSRVGNQTLTSDHSKALFMSSHCIVFCDMNTGKTIQKLEHEHISNFAMNKRGTLALTSSNYEQRTQIKFWDLISGQCLNTFFSDLFNISTLQIEELGSRCWITDANNEQLEVLDLINGKLIQSLELDDDPSFIFSKDGTVVFSITSYFVQMYNLAPLPIERITRIASRLIQNLSGELEEEESEGESDTLNAQMEESLERLPLKAQTMLKQNNLESILKYIQEEFVSDIVELFKKYNLLRNSNPKEAEVCIEHVHSLLEYLYFKVGKSELQEKIQHLFLKECFVQLKSSVEIRDIFLIFRLINVMKDIILSKTTSQNRTWALIESLEKRIDPNFRSLVVSAILIYFQETVMALKNNQPNQADSLMESAHDLIDESSKLTCLCLERCLNALGFYISAQNSFLISSYLNIICFIDADMHEELSKELRQVFEEEENEPFSVEVSIKRHLNIIQHFQQTLSSRFNSLKRPAEELSEEDQPSHKRTRN